MAASFLYGCGYLFPLWKGAQNDAHCNCIKPPEQWFFLNNIETQEVLCFPMEAEHFGFLKLVLAFCQTFTRRHYGYFFVTSFCQNCNFEKHFYEWVWISIRYFDFKCHITVSNFRKTKQNQWALILKGDQCLQKQPQNKKISEQWVGYD